MAKKLLNISLSSVAGAQLLAAAGTLENVPLARIFGEATDIKMGRAGQNATVMGDFRAINLETGEEFASSVLYLPRGLQEVVEVALANLAGEGFVRFAYDIWAEPEPKGKSYTIGFADLVEDNSKPDPMAGFAANLAKVSSFTIPKK